MLLAKRKVLAVKTETAYGTDSVPTATANAILAKKVKVFPMEGQDVERDLESAFLGANRTIAAGLHARIEFEVEPTPSGTPGTAPAWGPLLRATGCAQAIVASASVTYTPTSWPHDSVSIYFWHGGLLYKMRGVRGNAVLGLDAQGLPVLRFTFWGLFVDPADEVVPVPTLASQIALQPQVVNSVNTPTFTINAVALALRTFSFDLGAKVEPRLIVGREAILITDRKEAVRATVEAVALATFNPYALARTGQAVPVAIAHGTGAGRVLTLSASSSQLQRPSGNEENQNIIEWSLGLVPGWVAGNDQWSIALT